jgi:WD40 repeat protein
MLRRCRPFCHTLFSVVVRCADLLSSSILTICLGCCRGYNHSHQNRRLPDSLLPHHHCRMLLLKMLENVFLLTLCKQDEMGNVKGHFGPIHTLSFSPDGRSFASGSEDGYVRLHHFDQVPFFGLRLALADFHPQTYFDSANSIEKQLQQPAKRKDA